MDDRRWQGRQFSIFKHRLLQMNYLAAFCGVSELGRLLRASPPNVFIGGPVPVSALDSRLNHAGMTDFERELRSKLRGIRPILLKGRKEIKLQKEKGCDGYCAA